MKFKWHTFSQTRIKDMDKFLQVADQLDYRVKVTGGNFLTHEIKDDFKHLVKLVEELP